MSARNFSKAQYIAAGQELYDYMVLFDMVEKRMDGNTPYTVPERLMDSFTSTDGVYFSDILTMISKKNVRSNLESMSYMEYIREEKKQSIRRMGPLPFMPNSLKLWLCRPSPYRTVFASRDLFGVSPADIIKEDIAQLDRDIKAKQELVMMQSYSIDNVVNDLQKIMTEEFPDYYMKFTPYGSCVNGLAWPNSYLSINIEMDVPDMMQILNEPRSMVEYSPEPQSFPYMCDALQDRNRLKTMYDSDMKVVQYVVDGFKCEYGFNYSIVTKSTYLIQEYLKLDPRVHPLLKAFKYFGRGRNIFSPQLRSNSMRFYGYQIMILSYLMSLNPPVLPNLQNINLKDDKDVCLSPDCNTNKAYWGTAINDNRELGAAARYHNCIRYEPELTPCASRVKVNGDYLYWRSSNTMTVGELLVDFMHYYGYQFDFEKHAVSMKAGGLSKRKDEFQENYVVVEDPIISGFNLARNYKDIEHTKKFRNIFRGAFTLLTSGTRFDELIATVSDLVKYDYTLAPEEDEFVYKEAPHYFHPCTTKTIIIIGLPKIPEQDQENSCFCEHIHSFFKRFGTVESIADLDSTTKLLRLSNIPGGTTNISIPTSIIFNYKIVYLVELYDSLSRDSGRPVQQ